MELKIEEGKYYRTQDGHKVGPARKVNVYQTSDPNWAKIDSGGYVFEIVGVHPEDAFYTELVSEWDDIPKPWRDMNAEEKGALLLAHHEGKVIEVDYGHGCGWEIVVGPVWWDSVAYRVRPEPVRETVELYGSPKNSWLFCSYTKISSDTHRITFNIIDGEPDCDSITMEKL